MRAPLSTALLTCLALIAPSSAAAAASPDPKPDATQHCGPAAAKIAIIVVHGGGFLGGNPTKTDLICRQLGANGWSVTNIDYPVRNFLGTEQVLRTAALKAARTSARVFAYGESAGGGLAALAAARRWVDGAFAWAPVSDIPAWGRWRQESGSLWGRSLDDDDWEDLARISAQSWENKTSSPILVVHGTNDATVPFSQSVQMKKHWPTMTLRRYRGGHWPNAAVHSAAVSCFGGQQPCAWARLQPGR